MVSRCYALGVVVVELPDRSADDPIQFTVIGPSGSDYTNASGVLTWNPGESGAKTFVVPMINDALPEGNESAPVTILDDDAAALSVDNAGGASASAWITYKIPILII